MEEHKNPYSPGAGTPPPELAGRSDIITSAITALERIKSGRTAQSPILYGLRGVGKTVLLVHIRDEAEKRNYKTITIEAHDGKKISHLLAPELRKILLSLSKIQATKERCKYVLGVFVSFISSIKINMNEIDIGITINPEKGTADSGDLEVDLPDMLVALGEFAKIAKTPIAIFIDELQYLSEKEFSALIMAMHQINQRSLPILLLGAGLPQVLGLAGNSKSYSERLFACREIGPLEESDAIKAIVNPARKERVTYENAAINQLLTITHGYPYFIQQWAYEAWNVAVSNTIYARDITTAHNNAISVLDNSFFKVRFDRCTPSEKKYMRALASLGQGSQRSSDISYRLGKDSKSVAPIRAKLIKKGMIYSPFYGDTAFTVPLFNEYMIRVMPDN